MLKYNIVHVMSILRRYGHTVPVSTELFIVVNIGIHSFILPHSHSVSSPLVRMRYIIHPKVTTLTLTLSVTLTLSLHVSFHSSSHSHSVSSPLVRLRYMVHPKLTTAIHVTRRCEGKQVKATVCTGHCVWSWSWLGSWSWSWLGLGGGGDGWW